MGFRINTNIDALRAYYQLDRVNKETTKSQLRLSSGLRILNVADDTSGFNVGTSLKGKYAVMQAATNNISAAIDMLGTAEGALLGINDLLVNIERKISDATNPTNDRTALAADIQALGKEIGSTLEKTKFNDAKLLVSSAANGFVFQVGEAGDLLEVNYANKLADTSGAGNFQAGITASLASFANVVATSLMTTAGADSTAALGTALVSLKTAVLDTLGSIGNFQQRLEMKSTVIDIASTNTKSSISRLFDADIAAEQLAATRGSILGQAATAMLAQLNIAPQQVLQLFG